jgi:hypothetical protein
MEEVLANPCHLYVKGTDRAGSSRSYSFQMQRTSEFRFSATLGQEPEIELALV